MFRRATRGLPLFILFRAVADNAQAAPIVGNTMPGKRPIMWIGHLTPALDARTRKLVAHDPFRLMFERGRVCTCTLACRETRLAQAMPGMGVSVWAFLRLGLAEWIFQRRAARSAWHRVAARFVALQLGAAPAFDASAAHAVSCVRMLGWLMPLRCVGLGISQIDTANLAWRWKAEAWRVLCAPLRLVLERGRVAAIAIALHVAGPAHVVASVSISQWFAVS